MDAKMNRFQSIVEKLTPATQAYLLNLANVAAVAEESVKNEMKSKPGRKF